MKDLNEIGHHDHDNRLEQNESLDDFRSRLNMRRKIKTREVTNAYQDDDRTDNSCDSTTTKAHEEILRNANLLKQEKVWIQVCHLYAPGYIMLSGGKWRWF